MEQGYVLITAARNEGAYIRQTIESVLAQTILPEKWVIVSDGSTDGTDEIVRLYQKEHSFMELLRKERQKSQLGFASKVMALRMGYQRVKGEVFNSVGHLDADVSFGPLYYSTLLKKFDESPCLGIGGGFILEKDASEFKSRPSNSTRSVAGAIQLFRRKCYEDIGEEFIPLKWGGEDWCAEIMARMKGWKVESFPELKVLHHKKSTAARGMIRDNLRLGVMDYSFGSYPWFEILKCLRRIKEKPFFVGALLRFSGFLWCYWGESERAIPSDVLEYLRTEQKKRIGSEVLRPLKSKKIF